MVCNNLAYNSLKTPKCYENMFTATVLTILKTSDSRGEKNPKQKKRKKKEKTKSNLKIVNR